MHTMSALVASMDIMHRLYDLVSASFGKEVLLNNVCVHLTHASAMSGTTKASPLRDRLVVFWKRAGTHGSIFSGTQVSLGGGSPSLARGAAIAVDVAGPEKVSVGIGGAVGYEEACFCCFSSHYFFQMPFQGQNEGVRERGRERRRGLAAEYKEFTVSPTVRLEMRAHPRTGSR